MKWIVPFSMLFTLNACAPEPVVPGAFDGSGEVQVTVNGNAITMDMLEAITSHMPSEKRDGLLKDEQQKKRLVESLMTSNLLYNEALKKNVHQDVKVKRSLAMANREILANLYLTQIGDAAVTDEAIQAKYDSQKVKYGRPATHLHHFMVREQDKANALAAEIKGGKDFAEVAKANDPRTRMNGGDLGWINRAPIPDLEKTFNEAPLNELIGPVESRMGFHILKIEGRRDKTPIDEVRDQLAQMVKVDAMKSYQMDIKVNAKTEWPNAAPTGDDKAAPTDAPAPGAKDGHNHATGDGHNHEAH